MGFPCHEESLKATKRDIMVRKLVRSWRSYRYFKMIIVDDIGIPKDLHHEDSFDPQSLTRNFPSDRFYKPYVKDLIAAKTTDFVLNYGPDEFFSVEERPNSLFQFKTKHNVYLRDESTVFETYYSVIEYYHAIKLIQEGKEMEKEGGMNPLVQSGKHKTIVYILFTKFLSLSQSIFELVETMHKPLNDHLELHLVMDEKTLEETVDMFDNWHTHAKGRAEVRSKLREEGYVIREFNYDLIERLCSYRIEDSWDWEKCFEFARRYGLKKEDEK